MNLGAEQVHADRRFTRALCRKSEYESNGFQCIGVRLSGEARLILDVR